MILCKSMSPEVATIQKFFASITIKVGNKIKFRYHFYIFHHEKRGSFPEVFQTSGAL